MKKVVAFMFALGLSAGASPYDYDCVGCVLDKKFYCASGFAVTTDDC